MKKFVSLALALLMVCTLFAGCGKSDTPSDNTGKVPSTPDTPAPVAPDQGGTAPQDPDPGAAGKPNATPSDLPADPATPPADPVTPPADPVTPPADPVTPPADPETPPTDPVTPPADPETPPADPVTPPAADTDSYAPGYVDGNYWGSEWLGAEATFGGGYAMSTQQELIEATLIGSGVLFDNMSDSEKAALAAKAATSYEMMAKDGYGNNVNVTVEKLPYPMNVLDYIDILKQQLALTNGNPQFGAEPQGVEFCAQTWVVYEWTLDVMGYTVAQAGLFRLIDDRMAVIVFTMVDEYALAEMVSMFDVYDGVPNQVYIDDPALPATGTLENGVWTSPEWGMSYTVGAELSAMAGKELYDLIGVGQNETAFDLLVADAGLNTLLIYSQFNYAGCSGTFYIDNVLMEEAAQTDYVTPVEGSRKSVTVCGVEFESAGFEVKEGTGMYLDYYYAAAIEDRLVLVNVSAQTEDAVQTLMAGFGN